MSRAKPYSKKTFDKLCFFLFLFHCFISHATTYYVSPFGDDTYNGTSSANPWKTIAKVNNHQFQPGDKILFQKGGVWRETLYPKHSGTADKPISYSSYGTGAKPVINGADIYSGWALYKPNIWLRDSPLPNNVTVTMMVDGIIYKKVTSFAALTESTFYIDKSTTPDNIYIFSTRDINRSIVEISTRRNGIYVNKAGHLIISNLDLINCTDAGLRLDADNMPDNVQVPKFNGYTIIDAVTASNSVNCGIVTGTGYCHTTIKNSRAFANGNGFYAYEDADYTAFQKDTAYNNYNQLDPFTDGNGIGVYSSSFNTIENCISYDNKNGCGIEVDLGGVDSAIVIRYNVVYGNGSLSEWVGIKTGNLLGTTSNHIYYNLSYLNGNDPKDNMGREFYHHNGNISINNNTAYTTGTAYASALTIAGYGTVSINNNIFYSYGEAFNGKYMACIRRYNTAVVVANNNLYYSSSTTPFYNGFTAYDFSEWKSFINNDVNSLNADPLFVINDWRYNLKENSPAINKGMKLGLKQDILGKPIVGLPDIGAFETNFLNNSAAVNSQRFLNKAFIIFPNPTKGTLHLYLLGDPAARTEIDVFDNIGRKIFPTLIVEKPEGAFPIPIDVSNLITGIYTLRIYIYGQEMSDAFLKL